MPTIRTFKRFIEVINDWLNKIRLKEDLLQNLSQKNWVTKGIKHSHVRRGFASHHQKLRKMREVEKFRVNIERWLVDIFFSQPNTAEVLGKHSVHCMKFGSALSRVEKPPITVRFTLLSSLILRSSHHISLIRLCMLLRWTLFNPFSCVYVAAVVHTRAQSIWKQARTWHMFSLFVNKKVSWESSFELSRRIIRVAYDRKETKRKITFANIGVYTIFTCIEVKWSEYITHSVNFF